MKFTFATLAVTALMGTSQAVTNNVSNLIYIKFI